MKKSEWIDSVMAQVRRITPSSTAAVGAHRVAAQAALRVAEEAGVQWDPEEPELPKRLEVGELFGPPPAGEMFGRVTGVDLAVEAGGGLYRRLTEEEVYEAAARWNAVESFLAWCDRQTAGTMPISAVASVLLRDLDEERESLK